ncbi:MAG: NAD-dependent epimerase/dehydratase family protein [Deltaproteobacteria bacterium]|nr:NAD-dependent epimerase/dehydratase family protein [Deltaproteobacteria bacterium]
MRIAVIGGAGFIGSHSVRKLAAKGHAVTVIDDLSHGKRENIPAGVTLEVQDIREPALVQLFERVRPEAVLHLAAQMDVRKSVADPTFDAAVNVLGTVNVLESARRVGCKRIVFASSGGAVYGEQDVFPATESHARRPLSPYGVSKLCGEEYLSHYAIVHGMHTLALRYANVYGPGQDPHGEAGVVAIFCEKMLRGDGPVINGDGLQTRDYVHVDDVSDLNVLGVESTYTGALNVGTGKETDVVVLAGHLARALGWTKPLEHGPGKPGEQRRSVIDASLARKTFGWAPRIEVAEGLAATARWFASR